MLHTFNLALFSRSNRWKKRGLAITPTKYGISFTAIHMNQAGALLLVYTDGSVLLTHGGMEMGQGLHTKMVQVSRLVTVAWCLVHPYEIHTHTVTHIYTQSLTHTHTHTQSLTYTHIYTQSLTYTHTHNHYRCVHGVWVSTLTRSTSLRQVPTQCLTPVPLLPLLPVTSMEGLSR